MDRYCWTEYGMLKTVEIGDSFYRHGNVDKEIERYKHTLEHDTKEIKLLTAEIDSKDREIERLKNEKEWLAEELIELYERYTTTDMPKEEMKKMLFEEMKQALKEE